MTGGSRRRLAAQSRMELLLALRQGERLLVTLFIPLALLAFLATVDVVPVEGESRVTFLVPGILTLAVLSTGMVSLGIATAFERSYGFLKRLRATPLRRWELVAAKAAGVLAVQAVQIAAILSLALALGWEWRRGVLLAVALALIGTVAFTGLGLLLAGTLRGEATLGVANGLYVVLLLLGGIAFPLARLPAALEAVARVLPAAALTECLRAALDGVALPAASLAAVVAWAVAAPVAAVALFRWE